MHVAFKCLIGALLMWVIHYLAQTRHYYAAGLVLMLPAISLPTYYFMHVERGAEAVRHTALFGLLSVLAYVAFLGALYLCERRLSIGQSMAVSLGAWCLVAVALLALWQRIKP